MRPASLAHLFTRPALFIAASLVFWGATADRGAPADAVSKAEGERSCRATRPSFDVLCRCLGASLSAEQQGGFVHAVLPPTMDLLDARPAGIACALGTRGRPGDHMVARLRLRQCVVGPSPPSAVGIGA